MNKGKKRRTRKSTGPKKPYRPPELTVHGDLRALTRTKKGKKSDGTRKPATRTSGGNA